MVKICDTPGESYLFCLEKKSTEMPRSPPKKRTNSMSHEVYSPVVGHSLGGGEDSGQGSMTNFLLIFIIITHLISQRHIISSYDLH